MQQSSATRCVKNLAALPQKGHGFNFFASLMPTIMRPAKVTTHKSLVTRYFFGGFGSHGIGCGGGGPGFGGGFGTGQLSPITYHPFD